VPIELAIALIFSPLITLNMLLRLVMMLIVCSLYSCVTNDHLIDDLPLDSEGIAQKIAESQLFQRL